MKCLNCEKPLQPADAYCSGCGQSASTGRLQTPHILHHFYHAFTHTDKGFFYLMRELLVKPGIIAREYNEGKRKTYFSPFTFFLIVIALSTLLVTTFNIMNTNEEDPIGNFSSKHFNIIVLITIPLIGLFTSILFKNKGINFAEGIVLASYTSGERSIFFMILVVPLVIIFREYYPIIISAYLFLFGIYYAWSCCQYFSNYKWATWFKGIMCFALAQLVLTLFYTVAYTIYYSPLFR